MLLYLPIALMAFTTLVDLFATQAILPTLAAHYAVSPAAMGVAVNASTFGMAIAALAMAFVGRLVDRRRGVVVSLALLALPTAALAAAPDLATFTVLRVLQGLCMSSAFALTLSYLAEHCSMAHAAGAFAAYVTGNVASNLFGRLLSASLAQGLGLAGNFTIFALLNLAGAALAGITLRGMTAAPVAAMPVQPWMQIVAHLRERPLRTSFAIGFLILFAFIGTFTYVNFVLRAAPIGLTPMSLGLVYFVFAPALLTTPLAGAAVARWGTQRAFRGAIALALAGLPLLLVPRLAAVVVGLACVGAGTFFAQAAATGFVGRAASGDPGSASGMYLASYFSGGLVGSAVVGALFQQAGWPAAVAAIGAALALTAWLAGALVAPKQPVLRAVEAAS
jgi:predicted MFS family arabinose efflux permease